MAAKAKARGARATAAPVSRVDHVAASYNEVPYASHPFAETQPERVAAVARLFGFRSPTIETARVLELGAASGGNLLPLAARYPQARFLGVDISGVQIAAGRDRIARAGLTNIELRHQSIADPIEGKFDYIICHGVYSWVPEQVRDAILRVCKQRLAPDGIAYVSYNVLPGWRVSQVIRDSLLILVEGAPIADRAKLSRDFLNYIAEHAPANGPYSDILRQKASAFGSLKDDYITHEHLEGTNEPCTFTKFARDVANKGLAYLGEAEFSAMLPETWVGTGADALRAMAGNDLIRTEQCIDILSGRTFRRSLLVHADKGATVRRFVEIDDFVALNIVAPLGLHRRADTDAAAPAGRAVFADPHGRTLTTDRSWVAEAFDRLIARLPASSTVDDLAPMLAATPEADMMRLEIIAALFKLMTSGMAALSTRPIAPARTAARPEATALARADAARFSPFTASRRHEPVALDIVAHHILPLADGAHSVDDLYAEALEKARADIIQFLRAGEKIIEDEALRACAKDHVDHLLNMVAGVGLLVAA